jgi:hypothetical protein
LEGAAFGARLSALSGDARRVWCEK